MKKVIAVVLVLMLMLTSSVVCFAKTDDKIIPKAKVKTMTVLGDSVAAGYGLDGYDAESNNTEILSYANLVASYYGLTLGKNYFNYSQDGATSAHLLKKLSSELSEEEYNNIAKSDVIVVSISGNDLLEVLLEYMKEFLKLDKDITAEQIITKLSKMSKDELKDLEKRADKFYKTKEKDVNKLCEEIGENISSVSAKLKEIAPKAQIYIQNIYNPINELPQYKALSTVNGKIISKLIDAVNTEISDTADKKGMYVIDVFAEFSGRKENCTNISDFDVHPNQYGHSIIADALQVTVDNVYDMLNGGNQSEFSEGEFPWIWFAVAAVVIASALPVVFFVVKKSSGIKE